MQIRPGSLLLAAWCACAGACSNSSSPPGPAGRRPALPTADEVAEVRFIPNKHYRPGLWPDATLTRPEAIREVVEWLHAVDWSAAPSDLTRIDVPPLSELRLTKRDGTKVSYSVYKPCIVVGYQVWGADTDRLVLLLQKGAAEPGAAPDPGRM